MSENSATARLRARLTYGGRDFSLPIFIVAGFAISLIVYWLTADTYAFPKSVTDRFDFAESINNGEAYLQQNVRVATRAAADFVGFYLERLELFLWFEPWPIVVLAFVLPALHYGGLRLALFTLFGVMFWGMMDLWDAAMSTLALMGVSVLFSVVLGVIVGIWCSQSDRVEAFVRPILDTMQTMPSFVYLTPAIFFFGIGGPSATMAIIVYAMPPSVRLTNLGIRQVPSTTLEAARSFGSTNRQLLWKIQVPQAMPSIILGINQTIMMALGLAVLAVFIGAGGLGEEVWKALRRLNVGWSFEAGLAIVFMAIIFDRLSLAMSAPKESGAMEDKTELTFRLLPQKFSRNPVALPIERAIDAIWRAVAALGSSVAQAVSVPLVRLLALVDAGRAKLLKDWLDRSHFLIVGLLLILAILVWDAWIAKIGFFPKGWQFQIREPIDQAVEALVINPVFIAFTKGVKDSIFIYILRPSENFLIGLPWFYVCGAFFVVVWASAGLRLAAVSVSFLLFTGAAGLWVITMQTLAATVAAVALCVLFGLPLGIIAAYNRTIDGIVRPILDTMQTMPAFVYLIPMLMFFGGNKVTAVMATVIYALPPMVRMTILGLRELPTEINEVSGSFGSSQLQSLIKVKLPMASPSIMLGVNQAVVMALAMQVVTPLIAGEGLGKEVYTAMNLANTGRGLVGGVGIVLLAIMLDRLTQAWTKNQRKALGI